MSEDEKKIPSSDGKKLEEENSFEIQSVSPNLPQDDHVFGPSLPPHLLEKKLVECRTEQKIYGPVLPNSLRYFFYKYPVFYNLFKENLWFPLLFVRF